MPPPGPTVASENYDLNNPYGTVWQCNPDTQQWEPGYENASGVWRAAYQASHGLSRAEKYQKAVSVAEKIGVDAELPPLDGEACEPA